MRLTGRSAAPWRHPALASMYGAVIAFGAVALASLVVDPQVLVTVTASPITDYPTVQIHDGEEVLVAVAPLDRNGSWSELVTPGNGQVCLTPPPGWAVAGATCQSVTDPADGIRFHLERQ
jgi:hypothetical protein